MGRNCWSLADASTDQLAVDWVEKTRVLLQPLEEEKYLGLIEAEERLLVDWQMVKSQAE